MLLLVAGASAGYRRPEARRRPRQNKGLKVAKPWWRKRGCSTQGGLGLGDHLGLEGRLPRARLGHGH